MFFRLGRQMRQAQLETQTRYVLTILYKIVTTGTTDFTAIGAADSNVGTVFIATGAGTGTGTAQLFIPDETHNVSIVNSYIGGNITNTTKLTESFNVSNNKYIDYITSSCAGATAKIVVSDNAHIGGGLIPGSHVSGLTQQQQATFWPALSLATTA